MFSLWLEFLNSIIYLSILKFAVPNFIKNNSELMKKIKELDFDSVKDMSQGTFNIILKKKL